MLTTASSRMLIRTTPSLTPAMSWVSPQCHQLRCLEPFLRWLDGDQAPRGA
jgi:hypothetical protein